jgi:rhodanese-related sulfurtransferase
MVAEAKQQIENLSPIEVAAEIAANRTLLLDIREAGELLQNGVIPGAVAAPRGMLEFYADMGGPYHREEFDPQRRMILYCASGDRSALAAATLQQIGYTNIAHLDGGLEAWQAASQLVVPALKWHQPHVA